MHTSWDRTCLEFLRRCSNYDDRSPENNLPYFPSDQDWTLATQTNRIPLREWFPKHLAVNSLPSTTIHKTTKHTVRPPPKEDKGKQWAKEGIVDKLMNRM